MIRLFASANVLLSHLLLDHTHFLFSSKYIVEGNGHNYIIMFNLLPLSPSHSRSISYLGVFTYQTEMRLTVMLMAWGWQLTIICTHSANNIMLMLFLTSLTMPGNSMSFHNITVLITSVTTIIHILISL